MKALITAGAVLAIAGAASATDFTIPDSVLGGGESVSVDITLGMPADGFEIVFDFTNGDPNSDASWASDVQVIVSNADGAVLTIGGFTNGSDADLGWAFDGSGSTNDGTYGEAFAWPFDAGDYTITFVNDWDGDTTPNTYSNISGSFSKIPTPGAAGLLGLAGLAAVRRRR